MFMRSPPPHPALSCPADVSPVAWFAFHFARPEGIGFGFECLRPIRQGQCQLMVNKMYFEGAGAEMGDAGKVNLARLGIYDFDRMRAKSLGLLQRVNANGDGWPEAQDMLAALDCLFENAVIDLSHSAALRVNEYFGKLSHAKSFANGR
jgi:hypothetical protein